MDDLDSILYEDLNRRGKLIEFLDALDKIKSLNIKALDPELSALKAKTEKYLTALNKEVNELLDDFSDFASALEACM